MKNYNYVNSDKFGDGSYEKRTKLLLKNMDQYFFLELRTQNQDKLTKGQKKIVQWIIESFEANQPNVIDLEVFKNAFTEAHKIKKDLDKKNKEARDFIGSKTIRKMGV